MAEAQTTETPPPCEFCHLGGRDRCENLSPTTARQCKRHIGHYPPHIWCDALGHDWERWGGVDDPIRAAFIAGANAESARQLEVWQLVAHLQEKVGLPEHSTLAGLIRATIAALRADLATLAPADEIEDVISKTLTPEPEEPQPDHHSGVWVAPGSAKPE